MDNATTNAPILQVHEASPIAATRKETLQSTGDFVGLYNFKRM
jgi:hypothetical protein